MRRLEEIDRILAERLPELRAQFGVREFGIFGSCVRNEQTPGSDVDILVSFERPVGFLAFLRLESYLASLLGARVDLVSRKALKPAIGRRILSEVRFVT
jgi:predicted nucleotidyltransferase